MSYNVIQGVIEKPQNLPHRGRLNHRSGRRRCVRTWRSGWSCGGKLGAMAAAIETSPLEVAWESKREGKHVELRIP